MNITCRSMGMDVKLPPLCHCTLLTYYNTLFCMHNIMRLIYVNCEITIGLWWIDCNIFKNKFKSNNYVKMNISTYSEVFLNKYQALGFLGIEICPVEMNISSKNKKCKCTATFWQLGSVFFRNFFSEYRHNGIPAVVFTHAIFQIHGPCLWENINIQSFFHSPCIEVLIII